MVEATNHHPEVAPLLAAAGYPVVVPNGEPAALAVDRSAVAAGG